MNELTGWVLGQTAESERKEEELKKSEKKSKRSSKKAARRGKPLGGGATTGDVVVNLDSLDVPSSPEYFDEEPQYTVSSARWVVLQVKLAFHVKDLGI